MLMSCLASIDGETNVDIAIKVCGHLRRFASHTDN
jgi:hypothetical protein